MSSDLRPLSNRDLAKLEALLGADTVKSDPKSLERASGDQLADRRYRTNPGCVVRPGSTEQISELLRWANQEGVAVTPRGAGSGLAAGCVPLSHSIVCDLSEMNRIVEIDIDDRVAVVEAGVVTGNLDRALEPEGVFFAGYPISSSLSQIGGNISTNAGGGKAVKYGVTGNHVLGIDFVCGDGTPMSLGGRRRKDVAGYDMKSLVVGSEGTLGVVAGATLSLMPRPLSHRAVLASFKSPAEAVTAMQLIVRRSRSLPVSAEIMDAQCVALGATMAGVELPLKAPWVALFEGDGADTAEALRIASAAFAACRDAGADEVLGPDGGNLREEWWKLRKAIPWALKRRTAMQGVEDISLPPSSIDRVLGRLREIADQHGLESPSFGHLGDGNIHIHPMIYPESGDVEQWRECEERFLEAFYPELIAAGGTISGEHGIGAKRTRWLGLLYSDSYRARMRALKAVFDPRGIMNPGKAI